MLPCLAQPGGTPLRWGERVPLESDSLPSLSAGPGGAADSGHPPISESHLLPSVGRLGLRDQWTPENE